ncbi:MAG: gliding motility-associated C-terminal domain-containing protein [Bacteroidia bacterium]|nr:gliding motility-associated C-terminal domain-containing protein [Bacteroidia bacterium]
MAMHPQLPPPSLRCLEVLNNGDIKLTWVPVNDPHGVFHSYVIYSSINKWGPYTQITTINSLPVNSFIHAGALGNMQPRYYFMVTRYGPGGSDASSSSDTLKSMYLTLVNIGNGIAQISCSPLKNPPLPTTFPNYSLYREYPLNTFSLIYQGPQYFYNDTIDRCTAPYNYQMKISDQYGCISASQIVGDLFKDKTPPKIPSFDSVSVNASNQAVLGWKPTPNPDAVKYYIYVKDLITGIVTLIDSVPVTIGPYYQFNSPLPSMQSVAFHVATKDSCGNISPLNVFHQTIFLDYHYDICSGKVKLSWNPYLKFKNGSVGKYDILMSVNNGPYMQIDQTNQNYWESPSLTPNATHKFYIRAWNQNFDISASSNRVQFLSYVPLAPSFVYISSCSVLPDSSIMLKIYRDSLITARDIDILRSEDGIHFSTIKTLNFSNKGFMMFHDQDFKNRKGPVYYKAVLKDSCNNPRVISNLVASVWLKVKDSEKEMLNKQLEWTPYSGFDGGVGYYAVYRKSGNKTEHLGYTSSNTFSDNIEDIAQDGTDICYFVMAHEAAMNQFNLIDSASSVWVKSYASDEFFIPNAFVPGGINQVWKPVPYFVVKEDYELLIFNRWGNLIFKTNDIQQGWNGGSHPPGAYVYLIKYKTTTGEYKEKSGQVFLIR